MYHVAIYVSRQFDNYFEGEFINYRHKTLPYAVSKLTIKFCFTIHVCIELGAYCYNFNPPAASGENNTTACLEPCMTWEVFRGCVLGTTFLFSSQQVSYLFDTYLTTNHT